MHFLQTVRASIYNPSFYQNLKTEKGSDSFWYFIKLSFASACVIALLLIISLGGLFLWQKDRLASIQHELTDHLYPQELVVTYANGQISTNVNEPYAIRYPEAWRVRGGQDKRYHGTPVNLITINTQKPIELTDFERYNTSVIVGKDTIGVISDRKGKVEIVKLRDWDKSFTLDKATFATGVTKGITALKVLGVIFALLSPILIFIGITLSTLVYLLFGALVVWLAAKLTKFPLAGYGEAYKYSLHLITLPFLVNLLPINIPFLSTLVLFGISWANFREVATPGTMDHGHSEAKGNSEDSSKDSLAKDGNKE